MKKRLAIVIVALVVVVAIVIAICTSCSHEKNTATPDEAKATTSVTEAAEDSSIVDTALDEEESQAIVNAGLQVDDNGDIVDKDGNIVEADENGEVEIKTADGSVVKVSGDEVKAVVKSNTSSEKKTTTTTSNTSSSGSTSTSKNNTNSSSSSSKGNTNNNTASGSKPSNNNSGSTSNSNKPSSSSSSSSSSSDPHAGKTWHEAEYETVWVVDTPAYSYEEPIYEDQWRSICNTCGADITENADEHFGYHLDRGENFSYSNKRVQVQTGTKTVNVDEVGHYEKKLVREAGWY